MWTQVGCGNPSVWTQVGSAALAYGHRQTDQPALRLKVTIKVSSPIAVRSTNIVGLKVAVKLKVSSPTAGNPPEGKSSISHGRQISQHYSVKGDS